MESVDDERFESPVQSFQNLDYNPVSFFSIKSKKDNFFVRSLLETFNCLNIRRFFELLKINDNYCFLFVSCLNPREFVDRYEMLHIYLFTHIYRHKHILIYFIQIKIIERC